MKKLVLSTFILSVALISCAQKNDKDVAPDEQIVVNKKYDDQGNLIQYDSTYVHKWSLDSTYHFGISADSLAPFNNFPGLKQFMNEFWNDSLLGSHEFPQQPFSFGFSFSPFNDEDFWHNNQPHSTDSLFQRNFPYNFDSLFFDFGLSPGMNLPPGFNQDNFENFEKRLQNRFKELHQNGTFPNFDNKEQMEEWQKLMEKHRKEVETFNKKWKNKEK